MMAVTKLIFAEIFINFITQKILESWHRISTVTVTAWGSLSEWFTVAHATSKIDININIQFLIVTIAYVTVN